MRPLAEMKGLLDLVNLKLISVFNFQKARQNGARRCRFVSARTFPAELLEHLEQMRKFPDMEHDEPSKITLGPGKQGEIVWQFTKAGVVDFACLIPGHYEAGMKGAITVGRK